MKITKGRIKQFLNDTAAVSPAIATLILIVVAAVAAAAIGYIVQNSQGNVGTTLTDKGKDVQGKIVIDGSTTVLPVTLLAGPAFMTDNPGYTVTASGGGSEVGKSDVYNKLVDIGAASSVWGQQDFQVNGVWIPGRGSQATVVPGGAILQEAGPHATIWETTIGTGMIVVAYNINPSICANLTITAGTTSGGPVCQIKFSDLQNLYKGTAILGFPVTLTPVKRSDQSGTQETFAAWIGLVNSNDKQLASTVLGEQGNQGVRDYISNNQNTIGFVDIGFTQGQINGAQNVNAAWMNATQTQANASTKGVGGPYDLASTSVNGDAKHGLARDLYYYSYGTPTGAVKAYLDWIVGSKGQDQVHKAGFFSI